MKRIFVYGTLLEGFDNWKWALDREGSIKLGDHILEGNYTMVSLGGFPAVIPHEEGNTKIYGEIFEVTDDIYNDIEGLEGFPSFYQKETIETPWGDADMYIMGTNTLYLPIVESGSWKEYNN